MKRYNIGYTQGTYDMFHIGHLNLLNHAKEYFDYLIVGINADDLVQEYKHKTPVIRENERKEIVSNIKAVDQCEIVYTLDNMVALNQFHFDVIFIGDDWKGNTRWESTRENLGKVGVDLIFLPHTDGVSSTGLRPIEGMKVEDF